MISDENIFNVFISYSLNLLWWNFYTNLLLTSLLNSLSFFLELQEYFKYSRYKSFFRYKICKYFLQICGLIFIFLMKCLFKSKYFQEVQFINILFCGLCFWCLAKTSSPNKHDRFSLVLSFRSFIAVAVTFRALFHLDLVFVSCMKSASLWSSFILMFEFPSIICWKDYPLPWQFY